MLIVKRSSNSSLEEQPLAKRIMDKIQIIQEDLELSAYYWYNSCYWKMRENGNVSGTGLAEICIFYIYNISAEGNQRCNLLAGFQYT